MTLELSCMVLHALLSMLVGWTRSAFMALLVCAMLFVSGCGIYWMLGFEFMAVVNLYVYVGALAVLFLFVQMLLEMCATALWAYRRGVSAFGVLLVAGLSTADLTWTGSASLDHVTLVAHLESIRSVGHALYVRYADLLILNSFVLTVALFGALVHAQHRCSTRRVACSCWHAAQRARLQ